MKCVKGLTNEQEAALHEIIECGQSTGKEVKRALALIMLSDNMDEKVIHKLTGFERKYTFKLRKKYLLKGIAGILDKKKKLRALLTRQQRAQVVLVLTQNKPSDFGFEADFWSTVILAQLIEEQYGVRFKSRTSLYVFFKDAKFTYHKPDKQYHKYNAEEVMTWRLKTRTVLEQALADSNNVVLCEDEMLLTTQTTTQKVWIPVDKEGPKIEVSNKRNRRVIYGFWNVQSGREYAFKSDLLNSQSTCKILNSIGQEFPGKKIVIVWDNAPWHSSQEIKKFLSETKYKFHLIQLPRYAPEENPQEHVWKAGRSNVTHNKFIDNIDRATDDFVDFLNKSVFDYKFPALVSS